jgi:spore coat protein U-like protein
MKKILAVSAAAAILALAGTAMAATNATLAVTASVTNACSVIGGTLNFGSLDTLGAPQVTGTSAAVTVTCTKSDLLYTLAVDKGVNFVGSQANLKNTTGTDKIPYSLSVPAVPAATGAAQTISISGTIPAASYNLVSAGTYNDTVTITVTP